MKEYKDKSIGELEKVLVEKREALRVFRFAMSGSKVKNVKVGRGIRKDIARVMTEINGSKSVKS